MTRGAIPCTAFTMVRGNPPGLEHCLQSCLFCAEHLLLAGDIGDELHALAGEYDSRIILQDAAYIDEYGYIIDYAGVTNQGIAAAKHPWILILDSDEYLGSVLADEVQRQAVSGSPGAFYVDRLYTLRGRIIRAASTYPNRQIRLFHKEAIDGFVKVVHERPTLKEGVVPQVLPGIQFVPLDPALDLKRKYLRYLRLETIHAGGGGWRSWVRVTGGKLLRILLKIVRITRDRCTHRPADCLPIRYEMLNIWYAFQIILRTCPPLYRRMKEEGSVSTEMHQKKS